MRPDMHRVIIDCYRENDGLNKDHHNRARWRSEKARFCIDDEELDWDHTTPRSRYRKNQTDSLNPLQGYLAKHCGEQWDDVYHDICTSQQGSWQSRQHLIDHINRLVIKTVWRENNEIYQMQPYRRGPTTISHREFFVLDGILYRGECKRRYRDWKHHTIPHNIVVLDKRIFLESYGVWYEIRWSAPPEPVPHQKPIPFPIERYLDSVMLVINQQQDEQGYKILHPDNGPWLQQLSDYRCCLQWNTVSRKQIKRLQLRKHVNR